MTVKEFEIQLALGTLSDDAKIKVARNSRTSRKVLTILSTDETKNVWEVRIVKRNVASNPNTPVEVLAMLSEDKDANVRCSANENLGCYVRKNLSKFKL